MTTLKERFDLLWAKDDEPRLRNFALSFFRQELLTLAEEVEKSGASTHAALIRAKAETL